MRTNSIKAAKELKIRVRFMTHCFSRKYDPATHPEDDPIVRDAAGRLRSFCPIRYELSFRLPGLIRALNHPKAAVTQTARARNWLHTVTIDEGGGKYRIFFELRRAAAETNHREDLNLVVESAYRQDTDRREPAVRGSMGFILLCGKTYVGEPIATRR